MTKFTKGSWKRTTRNNNDMMITFSGVTIGDCYMDVATPNEHADAALIAAAPDLYAALTMLLGRVRSDEELLEIPAWVVVECEVAIAKARGE